MQVCSGHAVSSSLRRCRHSNAARCSVDVSLRTVLSVCSSSHANRLQHEPSTSCSPVVAWAVAAAPSLQQPSLRDHDHLFISGSAGHAVLLNPDEVPQPLLHLEPPSQTQQAEEQDEILDNEVAGSSEAIAAAQPLPDFITVQRLSKDLGVGQQRLQRILQRWPSIEQLDLDYVSVTILNLASFLQCKPVEAAAVVAREHRLLHTPTSWLQKQATELCNGMQVNLPDILPVLLRTPSLLFQQPQDVVNQATTTAGIFQVDLPELLEAAREEAWLLKAPPHLIQQRLQHLTEHLGVQPGPSVLAHPRLVCLSSKDLDSKIQVLCSSLHIKQESARILITSYPQLLEFSAERMKQHINHLIEAISLPYLQQMVFNEPSLLARSDRKLLQQMKRLQSLLSCTQAELLELLVRRPSLLARRENSLHGHYRALAIWRLSPAQKLELALAHPVLLRLSGDEIHGRCRWLRDLMLGNGYFHSTLRKLPMRLLGIVILHLPKAWSRLQYLADYKQEAGDIMEVVQSPYKVFLKAHPGYTSWHQWKCAGQGCSIPWRRKRSQQDQIGRQQRQAGDSQRKDMFSSQTQLEELDSTQLQGSRRKQGSIERFSQTQVRKLVQNTEDKVNDAPDQTGDSNSTPQVTREVHEGKTMLMGGYFVHKPQRTVYVTKYNTDTAIENAAVEPTAH